MNTLRHLVIGVVTGACADANILRGGSGDDDLRGREGDDDLDGGPGSNRHDGGPGTDRCVSPAEPPLAVNCETS